MAPREPHPWGPTCIKPWLGAARWHHQGLVQARWLLCGFAGEAWAIASAALGDNAATALSSQGRFPLTCSEDSGV